MLARVHRWSRVTWRFTLRPRWDFHQSPWKDKNWRIGRNPSDVDVSVSGGNPGRWNLPTPPKTFLSDDLQDGRLLTHIRNTLVGPLNNQSSRCRTPIHLKLNQSTFIVIQRKIKVDVRCEIKIKRCRFTFRSHFYFWILVSILILTWVVVPELWNDCRSRVRILRPL